MADELIFMMGNFEAQFPSDRWYAKNHMWAKVDDKSQLSDVVRFGFSAYAVRLLQDVYFLDWDLDAPAKIREKQEIGQIESSKAESALYAPIEGNLLEFNESLLSDPSIINVDKYERGWLFAMQGSIDQLLGPEKYLEHLSAAWKIAERTIKGQFNE